MLPNPICETKGCVSPEECLCREEIHNNWQGVVDALQSRHRYTVTVIGSIICVNGVYVANSFVKFRSWFLESGLDVRSFDNWPFELGIGENLLSVYEKYKRGISDWYPVTDETTRMFLASLFAGYDAASEFEKLKLKRTFPKYFNH